MNYDTKVHLWNNQGEHEFIIESHDQNKNSVESLITCKGHEGRISGLSDR